MRRRKRKGKGGGEGGGEEKEQEKKKKKKEKKKKRGEIRDTTVTTRKFTVLKNPMLCPVILLVKVMLEDG